MQTRSYDNNEGKRVYITEIVAESVQFLEPRNSQGGGNSNQGNQSNQGGQSSGYSNDPFAQDGSINISDDDLPF